MTDTPIDPNAYAARSRSLAAAIGRTLARHGYQLPEPVLHSVADTVIRADAADAPDEPACEQGAEEPSLYDKITGMFSGPLPPPGDQPPATVLPCNHAQLRQPHDPHRWEPQPGMRPAQCPGLTGV